MNPNRRTLIIQIIVLTVVFILVGILAMIMLPGTISPNQHRVTLRIDSSSGSATIQYNAGSNKQVDSEKTFSTPWERTWVLESGTQVLLTAGNYQEMGTLKCSIRLDGKNWKSESATMPVDKVACAGIVR